MSIGGEAWSQLLWPDANARAAIHALARVQGLRTAVTAVPDGAAVETHAAAVGLEAEPIETSYAGIDQLLAHADGILLSVERSPHDGWLLVTKGGARRLLCLTPDQRFERVATHLVRDWLCAKLEAQMLRTLEPLLSKTPPQLKSRVREALLRHHLAKLTVGVGWLLRAAPSGDFMLQVRRAGLGRRALGLLIAHVLAYAGVICSWALLGSAELTGHHEPGWWLAWALMIGCVGCLRVLSGRWQTAFFAGAAVLLKRRLFYGTLRLDRDVIHHEGMGLLLGRVLETEAIESLGLNGGLAAVLAGLELIVCLVLLGYGLGQGLHVPLLLLCMGLGFVLCRRYLVERRAWTRARLGLTQYVTEQMLGHRTRLVQQAPPRWHDREDAALAEYCRQSRLVDRWSIALIVGIPRAWLILGLAALAPSLLGDPPPYTIVVGIGACLLACNALQKMANGVVQLASVAIAWDQVAEMFHTGGQAARPLQLPQAAARSDFVLCAKHIVFRYAAQAEPVLNGVDLQIRHGEHILLEGHSGSGKSTLANIITGQRSAEAGVLLLNGLDQHTLGDAWRRYAVQVPQFHENHLLSESLAFNLLMGREWPPRPADLQAAEMLCHHLGLGELLERMPGGLWQRVGESGWRLSHGERSRVYLARALLSPATLILLDESFAALDPENVARAMSCVLARAPSLIVIAHP